MQNILNQFSGHYKHKLLIKYQDKMRIGIMATVAFGRKRRGESRLKQLQAQQKKKPSPYFTIYQYPTKLIFSFFFLLMFAAFLEWFGKEYAQQVANDLIRSEKIDYQFSNNDPLEKINEQKDNFLMYNHQDIEMDNEDQLIKIRKIINIAHIAQLMCLVALIFNLNLKIVKASRQLKELQVNIYSIVGIKRPSQRYKVQLTDRICIWQMGESRFTNTNYYYSIRIIGQQNCLQVIRKSSIFQAREVVIILASVLQLPYKTKITKMNQSNTNIPQDEEDN